MSALGGGRTSTTRFRWTAWSMTVAGVLAGALVAEGALRPFSSGLQNQWLALTDSLGGMPLKEFRQYAEGLATSHFRWDRERRVLPEKESGEHHVVIMGDSYTEALQVGDNQVFGAVAQTALAGSPTSVVIHQYGWSGADIPQYVAIAGAVEARYHPAVVVVEVSSGDFSPSLVTGALRLVEDSAGGVGAFGAPQARTTPPRSFAGQIGQWAGGHSVLVYRLARSLAEGLGDRPPSGGAGGESGDTALVSRVRLGLRALKDAYGPRVMVLMIADVGLDGRRPPSALEAALAHEGPEVGVEVVSTRAAMEIDARSLRRSSRGFLNTAPGTGHINVVGHSITGEVLAQALRARIVTPSGP